MFSCKNKRNSLVEVLVEYPEGSIPQRAGWVFNSMEAGRQSCLYHFPGATFAPDPDTTRTQSEVITHPMITWGRVRTLRERRRTV